MFLETVSWFRNIENQSRSVCHLKWNILSGWWGRRLVLSLWCQTEQPNCWVMFLILQTPTLCMTFRVRTWWTSVWISSEKKKGRKTLKLACKHCTGWVIKNSNKVNCFSKEVTKTIIRLWEKKLTFKPQTWSTKEGTQRRDSHAWKMRKSHNSFHRCPPTSRSKIVIYKKTQTKTNILPWMTSCLLISLAVILLRV